VSDIVTGIGGMRDAMQEITAHLRRALDACKRSHRRVRSDREERRTRRPEPWSGGLPPWALNPNRFSTGPRPGDPNKAAGYGDPNNPDNAPDGGDYD
jgi:hypothetical protein